LSWCLFIKWFIDLLISVSNLYTFTYLSYNYCTLILFSAGNFLTNASNLIPYYIECLGFGFINWSLNSLDFGILFYLTYSNNLGYLDKYGVYYSVKTYSKHKD